MIKFICLLTLTFLARGVSAQLYHLSGVVLDGASDKPLAGASVFINNASKGTVTNEEGEFTIADISSSTFELVVSFVSFETLVVNITPANINKRFRIELAFKEQALQEVIVSPVDKDGWKNWGRLFMDSFIGKSENAQDCRLINPQVLQFRYSKKTRILRVTALDQLNISNKALGYQITFQLEEFMYDSRRGFTTYMGYTSYKKMESKSSRVNARWIKNRTEAFNGSLMHFMRSFYKNTITEEGFEMHRLTRLYKEDTLNGTLYQQMLNGDTSLYNAQKYKVEWMKNAGISPNPIVCITEKQALVADSIRRMDSTGANLQLYFTQHITVTYYNELEKQAYLNGLYPPRKRGLQQSIIYLNGSSQLTVLQDGTYFPPLNLYTEGYWGWEKIAELLPMDYTVGN